MPGGRGGVISGSSAVVPQAVRGLYEGGHADEATPAALEFSDPLVCRASARCMFRRLSAFPATQVALTELDELGDGWSRWSVTVAMPAGRAQDRWFSAPRCT